MTHYPLLSCDLTKIRHNVGALVSLAARYGVSVAAVTKVVCAATPVVRALDDAGIAYFADSRLQNLESIRSSKPKLLLRIGMRSEAEQIVSVADVSLQSEISTVRALGEAAAAMHKRHRVVLMIDLGDLREGVFFRDTDGILALAQAVPDAPALELFGVGTNLTCFGGILPDETNLGSLCQIAEMLRQRFGVALPFVSGGNSSSLSLLAEGRMPRGITNLRLGESILRGNDTAACALFPGLAGDAFTFRAEIVELRQKPSVPTGVAGKNAFGERVAFIDRGEMRRAILACGRQDVDETGLTPLDPRVAILGASSDHLILDLTQAKDYGIGDTISFLPSYGALLRASTSPYVYKIYR